jgi:hypothetical protein
MFQSPIKISKIIFGFPLVFLPVSYRNSATPPLLMSSVGLGGDYFLLRGNGRSEAEATLATTAAEVETPIAKPTTEQTRSHLQHFNNCTSNTLSQKTATVTTLQQPEPTTAMNPNRGDNGRGRMEPAKKLMLSLVSVKRITSDIPASTSISLELEIAGGFSLCSGASSFRQ